MKKLHVKRVFAFLLSLMMLINLCIPMNVQAAEEVTQQTVKEVEIQVNESVKLTASGWSFMTTWESSDSSIVTVTNKGVITGMAEGTATVTATSKGFFFGNKKTEYLVHVAGEEVPEIPETETPETETPETEAPETEAPETEAPETEESSDVIKVKVGETVSLTAPEGTTTWSTSDSSVAEVSSNGIVTGVAEGTADITATTKTGGFKFWFMQWGGKTVTTTYPVKVEAGETEAPETEAPETEAPETEAPETEAPETEAPETEAPETEESTESDRPIKPENPSEVDEYYWENSKEVIAVINAKESTDVPTETEVLGILENRGFGDCSVIYEYSIDGEYCDETEVVNGSDAKRPMYLAFYVAEGGDVWTIYVTNGKVMAYPASFNLESDLSAEVLFSESEELTSYDYESNQFYVTVPKESAVILKVVDRIDAETLNKLTFEEIGK